MSSISKNVNQKNEGENRLKKGGTIIVFHSIGSDFGRIVSQIWDDVFPDLGKNYPPLLVSFISSQ